MLKKYFWNYFLILIIFLLDRISKIWIINLYETFGQTNMQITNFLSLNLIWNSGIGFGLLSLSSDTYYNILTTIIILITLIILWMATKTDKFEKIAFLMIFSGSLGNIFDRIYYSSVPDFIDINIGNFHWFIFNVADIFISLGVIFLIILEIFLKKKHD